MKYFAKFAAFALICIVGACSMNDSETSSSEKSEVAESGFQEEARYAPASSTIKTTEENTDNGFISSSAAVETGDTSRRFIRTAEMKFRVKNVAETTYLIEDLTTHFGGFVAHTNLSSEISRTTTTKLSADSTLETIYYTVSNYMTLRVPNTRLDTSLKSVAKLIDYLDYRIISAQDVSLEILSNRLAMLRSKLSDSQKTTTEEGGGKPASKKQQTTDSPLRMQERADAALLANLTLEDRINFSTIHLTVYQREAAKRVVVPNEQNIDEYKPGFGERLLESLEYGWSILVSFIVFIAKLWGFALLGIILFVLYKMYGHKLKIRPRK